MKKFDLTLYLVAGKGDLTEEAFLQRVEDACQGGVTLVQLREKGMDGGPLLALAGKVKKITDRYQVPLLIDDRVDVAFACRAAGVHLGQSDLPPEEARKILGGDAIIGVTVKTLEQGKAAVAAGADYFGVGAVFPTSTKKEAVHTPLEKIEEICRTFPVPCVAIGGTFPGSHLRNRRGVRHYGRRTAKGGRPRPAGEGGGPAGMEGNASVIK